MRQIGLNGLRSPDQPDARGDETFLVREIPGTVPTTDVPSLTVDERFFLCAPVIADYDRM